MRLKIYLLDAKRAGLTRAPHQRLFDHVCLARVRIPALDRVLALFREACSIAA